MGYVSGICEHCGEQLVDHGRGEDALCGCVGSLLERIRELERMYGDEVVCCVSLQRRIRELEAALAAFLAYDWENYEFDAGGAPGHDWDKCLAKARELLGVRE